VIALCRDRLGGVHAPKSVEYWPELPRGAVGKTLRRQVRERFFKDSWRAV
jgi:acyl-coenzyme A synthetase/AMP-(fatty) acid ligase